MNPTKLKNLSPDAICAATEALRFLTESYSPYDDEFHPPEAEMIIAAFEELSAFRSALPENAHWSIPSLMGSWRNRPLSTKGKAILSGEYWEREDYFNNLPPEQSPIPEGIVPGIVEYDYDLDCVVSK